MGISVIPAAASGPTLAQITTEINDHGSPIPSYELIADAVSISGVTNFTVSGLSDYKFLRIYVFGTMPGSAGDVYLRYNSDSGSNYSDWTTSGSSVRISKHIIGAFATSDNRFIKLDIENNIMYKSATAQPEASAAKNLIYESKTIISSITILNERITNFGTDSYLFVQGVR